MKITLPDGTIKAVESEMTGREVVQTLFDKELIGKTLAYTIEGTTQDLNAPLPHGGAFSPITTDSEEGLTLLRHSSAHLMALAILHLEPDVQFGFGPAIEDGFYYDFDNLKLEGKELKAVEAEMQRIVKMALPFQRYLTSLEEGRQLFQSQPYKLEKLDDLSKENDPDIPVSYYTVGEFSDLCRGPHVPHTGYLKNFALLRVAGAYWKGLSSNQMLKRIYGTSFPSKKELKEHLEKRKIAEENDHIKKGRELDLFLNVPEVGKGLPLLTPKGTVLLRTLQRFVEREETKRGYLHTATPLMSSSALYKISGHWDLYRDHMFLLAAEEGEPEMALRPMTCPFHFSIYNSRKRSYRELPLRYAETATLFRKESSGSLHGLVRVWQFTLADAHLICRPSQIEEEFAAVLDLANFFLKTLEIDDYTYRFSKWDPNDRKGKYIDDPAAWDSTQKILKDILDKSDINYTIGEGEAAFYGPKLDIQLKNVWGKEDTLITIQVDFATAKRFDMTYLDSDGNEKQPMIIHRSSIGCYERTIAMLIERFGGRFPFWLAPQQVQILTITDALLPYAQSLHQRLLENEIRSGIDERGETLGRKVRDAQLQQIPLIVTVGNKEVEENTLSIRTLNGQVSHSVPIEDFLARCIQFNKDRSTEISFASSKQ